MFSRTFQYGLQAAILLANRSNGTFEKVDVLSRELGVPRSVLAKVLHTLAAADVIETLRGPTGGCRWNPASDRLTLADFVRLLDRKEFFERCPLGFATCKPECCALPAFSPPAMLKAMEAISIQDLTDTCAGQSVQALVNR